VADVIIPLRDCRVSHTKSRNRGLSDYYLDGRDREFSDCFNSKILIQEGTELAESVLLSILD